MSNEYKLAKTQEINIVANKPTNNLYITQLHSSSYCDIA